MGSGAELCRGFHDDVLAPLLAATPYAAGLLGAGSDVLGHDDERSTDHDWGPRATVFVAADDLQGTRADLDARLPATYDGHPLSMGRDGRLDRHHVEVTTLDDWLVAQLGLDPRRGMSVQDWLLVPQQRLLGTTAGPVFHDPSGELAGVRQLLAWYPDDMWWWLQACQWRRLAQEEPWVQRTHEIGDDLGSSVVAARLVREAKRLVLLQERTYAPYGKWLGTAFAPLGRRDGLETHLHGAVAAPHLLGREAALTAAYACLAVRHNEMTGDALDPSARRFHDRPATVLGADRFADRCLRRVDDPELRALPLIGSVDQFCDSTEILDDPAACRRLASVYGIPSPAGGRRPPSTGAEL